MSATKYVARQLKSLLGTYLDGVSEDSLGLQLLSGKLKLENLKIRETAFADLELPFRASGRVGKMELSVNLLRHAPCVPPPAPAPRPLSPSSRAPRECAAASHGAPSRSVGGTQPQRAAASPALPHLTAASGGTASRFWWNEPVVIGLEDVDITLEPLQQALRPRRRLPPRRTPRRAAPRRPTPHAAALTPAGDAGDAHVPVGPRGAL
jgi:hypothetical protein